jgi:hypothetical protein
MQFHHISLDWPHFTITPLYSVQPITLGLHGEELTADVFFVSEPSGSVAARFVFKAPGPHPTAASASEVSGES